MFSLFSSCVVALVAMTLSPVAAGSHAAKQRVAIDTKVLPQGTFVVTPLASGALKPDSGKVTGNWPSATGRSVMRNGQTITIYNVLWTFTGRRGTLTIRERNEWVHIGNDANNDGEPDSIAVGTWKVVRGTGQYVRLAGGGRSSHEGLGRKWYARYEGIPTIR